MRLREHKVTDNPDKTRLGLKKVEYVGHLISIEGTPFTPKTASVMLNHVGKFRSLAVIHTDQGPAFHDEVVIKLLRLCGI